MSDEPNTDSRQNGTCEDLDKLQGICCKKEQGYRPRPKWQLIYAWILIAIVVAGICCSIYWLAFASAA